MSASTIPPRATTPRGAAAAAPSDHRRAWFGDRWQEVPLYLRTELCAGQTLAGPAIIAERNATTVVEPGWHAGIDARGALLLERQHESGRPARDGAERDPVLLEIFNNQFMHLAEQMGAVLQQTAHSVNIKERLDYSCALFDAKGGLIANAPHVPIHLGSMGDSVREVLRSAGRIEPGDAFMLNAPYSGGTHLPDITVVTPVFEPGSERPDFIVASRAHHADIGGITPGSMPATSRRIEEEGVVFECLRIVSGGRLLEDRIRERLAGGPYPARNPEQNLADLKAQLAANMRGSEEIGKLLDRHGSEVVHAYMSHVQHNAEECMRRAIGRLRSGAFELSLDGGERIAVSIRVDTIRREASVDFTGTSPMSDGNYNAPAAIAHAVVLYVFRTLIDENIPLNAGCLAPLTVSLPAGSLVDPRYPAAVVAGNVETSQCIADALLAALDVEAASQGTMNNFTFGDGRYQYYETLCGGCGAGPGFDGASAVHSHMTNSRLTDVEVLEQRFPVRVLRFAIRRGSGGSGRWRGGDGVVREIEFLEPMQASILSNRRTTAPFGLDGGGDGRVGSNRVLRRDGRIETLGAAAEAALEAGDRFLIETPGGGGYGRAPEGSMPGVS